MRDECNFFRGLDTFDDLLRCPGTVLMDTNHRDVRGDALQHGKSRARRALLEQLLDNLKIEMRRFDPWTVSLNTYRITQPVRRKVNDLSIKEVGCYAVNLFDRDVASIKAFP